jgi:hypothetical protein
MGLKILKLVYRLLVVFILLPMSLLGLVASWQWFSTDKEKARTGWIESQHEHCQTKGNYERCMEDAYKAIGGEILVPTIAAVGTLCLVILCLLLIRWFRKK